MERSSKDMIAALESKGVSIQISKLCVGTGVQTSLGTDGAYPIASLYKFLFLLEAIAKGSADRWKSEISIDPSDHAGGFGIIRGWPGRVSTSLENLAYLVMFHSDGTAAELLFNSDRSPFRIPVTFEIGRHTVVTMHHAQMVQSVNELWKSLCSETERRQLMSKPLEIGGKTSAEDFVSILKNSVLPLLESSPILRKMALPRDLGPIRPARRIFGSLNNQFHCFGKTGTLGFGYVLNDSGIFFRGDRADSIVAVTSFGWNQPIEASELELSELTAAFLAES